jgi:hypothetical protein
MAPRSPTEIPGEALYRKLVAEAREQRWAEALERALARVAIEREELAREAEEVPT